MLDQPSFGSFIDCRGTPRRARARCKGLTPAETGEAARGSPAGTGVPGTPVNYDVRRQPRSQTYQLSVRIII